MFVLEEDQTEMIELSTVAGELIKAYYSRVSQAGEEFPRINGMDVRIVSHHSSQNRRQGGTVYYTRPDGSTGEEEVEIGP